MTKKKEEIVDNNIEEIRVVEASKKKTPVGLIIGVSVIIGIAIVFSTVLPFIFTFGIFALAEDELDFKVVDENKISIPSENTMVERVNEYYDKEDECYILQVKVDHDEKKKKSSTFFDTDTSLEVTYLFKDEDGYVIGEEILTVDDFDNSDKVKKNVYYCEGNAKKVKSVEVKKVSLY